MLRVHKGNITENGVRMNIDIGIQYIESWLRGNGCVPIYNLMEDAATAEISRTQVWQWLHHGALLADGRPVTAELVRGMIPEVLAHLKTQFGAKYDAGKFPLAAELFEKMTLSEKPADFLTLEAYSYL
jgi:malate synthase